MYYYHIPPDMTEDAEERRTEGQKDEGGWSIIEGAQVCLMKDSERPDDTRKGIVCVNTAKPREIIFEGIKYRIGAEDSILVVVGEFDGEREVVGGDDERPTVMIKVPLVANLDELKRLETWARLSVGKERLRVLFQKNVENDAGGTHPGGNHREGGLATKDDESESSVGKSATTVDTEPREKHQEASESSSEGAVASDEEWPSSDEIASRIIENSDWAAQCIQSGAGHLKELMRGFTDYTVPEDSAVKESGSSEDNEDAKAVFEGLKSASGAVASAANSAVGTVGGYIVRAGSSALEGLREEMKDDENFVAADKVGSAAVTGIAKVLSGLSSAKSDLQGAAADEVSKAAARKYGKDAGKSRGSMVRDSFATAGNATSVFSAATPSNVISQGMKQSSTTVPEAAQGRSDKVEEVDLLGLSDDEVADGSKQKPMAGDAQADSSSLKVAEKTADGVLEVSQEVSAEASSPHDGEALRKPAGVDNRPSDSESNSETGSASEGGKAASTVSTEADKDTTDITRHEVDAIVPLDVFVVDRVDSLPAKTDINERLRVLATGSHPSHAGAAVDGHPHGHSSQWRVTCCSKQEGVLCYGDVIGLTKKVRPTVNGLPSLTGADEAAGGSDREVVTVALCIDKEASVGAVALAAHTHAGVPTKLRLPELCRWTIISPDDLDAKKAVPLRSSRVLLRNRWGQYLSVADVTSSASRSPNLCCRESSKRQECLWLLTRMDIILPHHGGSAEMTDEEDTWPFVPLLPRTDFSTIPIEDQERVLILEILGAMLGGRVTHITQKTTHRASPRASGGRSPWESRTRLMLCGVNGCDISLQQVAAQILPIVEYLEFVKSYLKAGRARLPSDHLLSPCAVLDPTVLNKFGDFASAFHCTEHEGWGFGTICEGLCEELNTLIADVYVRVAELRTKVEANSEMTISAVKLCLLRTSQELELVCRVLRRCWHQRGGAIIDSIHDQRTTIHDGALHLRLLFATVTPFLSLLFDWMLQGKLLSSAPIPQQEFLIVDKAPDMLCNSSEAEKSSQQLFTSSTVGVGTPMQEAWRRALAILIDKARKWAAEQLYTYFIDSLDLKGRLSSIHSHFLLARSDWLSHFLDSAGEELETQLVDSIDMNRINTLLDFAIRSNVSSTHADPYCGEMVACMHTFLTEETPRKLASRSYTPYTIVQRSSTDASRAPTGIRCFTLGLREVKWPLSLILSTAAVFKLQVIFRHLCYCRWVQNRLSQVWLDFQSTKPFYSPGRDTEGLQAVFDSSVLLCRMKQFVTNYVYYATTEVIQPRFETFLQMLESPSDRHNGDVSPEASSLEMVMSSFQHLLDTLLREMLLTSESVSLYKYLAKMLSTCSLYAKHMGSFSIGDAGIGKGRDDSSYYDASFILGDSSVGRSARDSRLDATREHYVNKVSAKHYKAMIDKFRDTFDSHLKGFLGALQNRTAERGSAGGAYVQNLAHRLDYNEFYTKMYGFDVTENWGT
ncbi:Gamma-tubulin complex component 2 [Perkinsus olseni]|uniref:Gamma-tubulin complex component 2 n=2 Tax=Perkinsus olseni TaxID=32597 RepID=A0A7J6LWF6_PEROL|nr:Gamma-tubulin complex component 2 [Perkinsus olseni]